MKFLAMTLIVVAGFLSCGMDTEYKVEKTYHVVQSGQTLWEIAGENISKQDKYEDIREFIHVIRDTNNIYDKPYLEVGERLVIPLYKEVKK